MLQKERSLRHLRKLAAPLRAIIQRVRLAMYDDWNIAEHFRTQGARIGENCRLQIRSLGSEPWLVEIGSDCTLSSDVTLVTHDGAASLFTDQVPSAQKFGAIQIGNRCFIGAGSIVLPGVRIGPNAVVGAGSVVTRDVPPDSVAAGVPARRICSLQDYRERVLAAWKEQRPPGYLSELQEGVKYSSKTIHAHKLAAFGQLRAHLERTLRERR